MKVLIIGGGGREHALAWQCAASDDVEAVFVAPGNAGTALENKVTNVDIDADNIEALAFFAGEQSIDLTIVGPEAPLVCGIVDYFSEQGLACFGPSSRAAQLEGSKSFSKAFLEKYAIPTAKYRSFRELDAALTYIREQGAPIVIKADGLAAGKGVIVALTLAEAEQAARDMLEGGSFGDAGTEIVVEEFLPGEEASFIVVTDGQTFVPLATSQDHKARDEGDQGPNTGGMGAYSPAPVVTADIETRIINDVIEPTLRGMRDDGNPYVGFLYAGLMIGADGSPKVIEFNCRMGDPETQPIMMRLKSSLAKLCLATLRGTLAQANVRWDSRAALGVVMAAGGYPERYAKGHTISGLESANSATRKVFHAGTSGSGDSVKTCGGRVLCVVGLGDTVTTAAFEAYAAVDSIAWDDAFVRRDIGYRAIRRERG